MKLGAFSVRAYAGISAIATLLLFSGVIYVSCKRDSCNTFVCLNGGACVSGKCACPTYYRMAQLPAHKKRAKMWIAAISGG